jgi:hypothetical protein
MCSSGFETQNFKYRTNEYSRTADKRYCQKHKYEINEKLKNKRKNLQIEK